MNIETFRVSPRIHSEYSVIGARPTPNANTFYTVGVEHCFVKLISFYCEFTVITWLDDCEDMKLVVPTQVILFH